MTADPHVLDEIREAVLGGAGPIELGGELASVAEKDMVVEGHKVRVADGLRQNNPTSALAPTGGGGVCVQRARGV